MQILKQSQNPNDPFLGKKIIADIPNGVAIAGFNVEYNHLRMKVLKYDWRRNYYFVEMDTADEHDGKITIVTKEFLEMITRRI